MTGGTDFELPLTDTLRLINECEFDNADVVFVTDGECAITNEFAENFFKQKHAKGFTVQGILLNKDEPFAGKSLEPFCDKVYKQSDFGFDEIAEQVIGGAV